MIIIPDSDLTATIKPPDPPTSSTTRTTSATSVQAVASKSTTSRSTSTSDTSADVRNSSAADSSASGFPSLVRSSSANSTPPQSSSSQLSSSSQSSSSTSQDNTDAAGGSQQQDQSSSKSSSGVRSVIIIGASAGGVIILLLIFACCCIGRKKGDKSDRAWLQAVRYSNHSAGMGSPHSSHQELFDHEPSHIAERGHSRQMSQASHGLPPSAQRVSASHSQDHWAAVQPQHYEQDIVEDPLPEDYETSYASQPRSQRVGQESPQYALTEPTLAPRTDYDNVEEELLPPHTPLSTSVASRSQGAKDQPPPAKSERWVPQQSDIWTQPPEPTDVWDGHVKRGTSQAGSAKRPKTVLSVSTMNAW